MITIKKGKKKNVDAHLEHFLNQKKKKTMTKFFFESFTVRPRLGGGNEMEWKKMKKIILKYSSLYLVWEF